MLFSFRDISNFLGSSVFIGVLKISVRIGVSREMFNSNTGEEIVGWWVNGGEICRKISGNDLLVILYVDFSSFVLFHVPDFTYL